MKKTLDYALEIALKGPFLARFCPFKQIRARAPQRTPVVSLRDHAGYRYAGNSGAALTRGIVSAVGGWQGAASTNAEG